MVKEGYKQTGIGVLPEDWEVDGLLDRVQFIHGKAHEQEIVEDGDFVVVNSKFVSTEGRIQKFSSTSHCTAKTEDVLMVLSDLPNGKALAKCYFVEEEKRYAVNQRVCIFRAREDFPKYLYYVLNRNDYFLSLDDGVSQTHILNDDVRRCEIQFPPTVDEQKAIAEALSDVDGLIAELEALITKKRALKTATMQQLLTGNTRLPGFETDWTDISLFDLCDRQKALFDDGDWVEAEHIRDRGIRLVQTGNIGVGSFLDRENKKYISLESFNSLGCKDVFPGDLLICRLADPAGRACVLPDVGEARIITSVDVTIARPHEGSADRRFLAQVMCSQEWFDQVAESTGGTTHKRISRGNLGEIRLRAPCIEEQKAIADILTDMDGQIHCLEGRLVKTNALKQGMMQELLTGKTRLV